MVKLLFVNKTIPCQQVIWGITTMERIITDKKELIKLISYLSMADGGLYLPNRKDRTNANVNASFIMNMKAIHMDYALYSKAILDNVTSVRILNKKDYNVDGYSRQPQFRLETNRHPMFTQIRERIYTGKYKGLDPHYLKLLDWETLAILYMSDGCRSKSGEYFNVTLNLKRLSYGDLNQLKDTLKDLLFLEWNINRQNNYYYLRLRRTSEDRMFENIASFILPSFQYKIPESFRTISSNILDDDIV
jgi:hypothetical protein